MTEPLRVSTGVLADWDQFSQLVERILGSTEGVHLDMREFDIEGGQRLSPLPLLLLSNLFLGRAATTPVRVTLPQTDAARLVTMRSGLVFSLLSRPSGVASTTVELPDRSSESFERWVELWTQPWSPREPAVGRLFDDEPRAVDSRDYAGPGRVISNPNNAKRATRVVVDPHRRSREFLHSQSSQGLARRWLRLVTPSSRDADLLKRRETWISLVAGRILTEPLLNLADHAIKCPKGETPRTHIRSLALLARTDGGRDSYPRLQMLVADNGYGIVPTLRPKLRASESETDRQMADQPGADLLHFVVSRPARTAKDPGLPWARVGFDAALAEVASTEQGIDTPEVDAEFTVISGDPDNNDAATWVTASRDGSLESQRLPSLPFVGTTVFVTLPMPRPDSGRAEPSHAERAVSGSHH